MGEGETGADGSGDRNAREVAEAVGRASASLGLAVRASIVRLDVNRLWVGTELGCARSNWPESGGGIAEGKGQERRQQ